MSHRPSPEDVLALIQHRAGTACFGIGGSESAWTVVAWNPVETESTGAWDDVGRRLSRPVGRGADDDVPFGGGCLGYIGFGAGHRVESVPAQAVTAEPEVWLSRYEGALCYRHADQSWHAAGTRSFKAGARELLERVGAAAPPTLARSPARVRTVAREIYEDRVRRIQDYIAAGDCYQVNLTRAVHLEGTGPAFPAWQRLRRLANAPYHAWIGISPELVVLSSSPELFLEVDGRRVVSRPIKGTRPRHPDPVVDRALAHELRTSSKEKAELTMIVDLVRNDLGRIAVPGSVRFEPRRIVGHANVHHASQDVVAELAPGADAWSALAATFPPGSVTGAPKVRACERIDQLEDEPRGVYCGAIGFVADHGRAVWNVAIRTAVWTARNGGSIRYHVGGGIVADSDPAAEWDETVHKGTVMGRAFAGTPAPAEVALAVPDQAPRPRP